MEAHRVAEHYRLIGPTMEQPQYNLFEREKIDKEYLDVFRTVGLGTTTFSPLASGLLSGKYNEGIPKGSRFSLEGFDWLKERWFTDEKLKKVKKLGDLAAKIGTTTAGLSIAWCLKNPNVSTVILGASKKQQLNENLKALDAVALLTPAVIEKIESIVQTKPTLPAY
jgi:aryl-alcohol dehydrogenase-like predicted oxidoreductase